MKQTALIFATSSMPHFLCNKFAQSAQHAHVFHSSIPHHKLHFLILFYNSLRQKAIVKSHCEGILANVPTCIEFEDDFCYFLQFYFRLNMLLTRPSKEPSPHGRPAAVPPGWLPPVCRCVPRIRILFSVQGSFRQTGLQTVFSSPPGCSRPAHNL